MNVLFIGLEGGEEESIKRGKEKNGKRSSLGKDLELRS